MKGLPHGAAVGLTLMAAIVRVRDLERLQQAGTFEDMKKELERQLVSARAIVRTLEGMDGGLSEGQA